MSTTIIKSNIAPSIKSMMGDFWSADGSRGHLIHQEMQAPVNVRETKNHYELELAVPGFKKDNFKIISENGILTIFGKNETEKSDQEDSYTRKEFSYSSFTRSFSLPDDVVENHIDASYHHGILTIDLKKSGKRITEKREVKIN